MSSSRESGVFSRLCCDTRRRRRTCVWDDPFLLPSQFNVLCAHTPLQAKRKSVRLAIRPLVMKNIIQRDNYFPIKVEVVKGQSVREERSFGEKRLFPLFSRTSFTVRRSWPAERERAIMPVAQPIPMAWHCICTLCWDNPNRSSSPIIRTLIIFLLDRHEH